MNITYVPPSEGDKRQQELMEHATSSFYDQKTASGEKLFEIVYLKVATDADLSKVVNFLMNYWDEMDRRDRTKWAYLLTCDWSWFSFYRQHISDCEHYCHEDHRLLWLKLVPTTNTEYQDLLTIGYSLDCLSLDVLKEVDKQCEPDSWQRKVLARMAYHDLSGQSDVLKGFLMGLLLGKVLAADMQAIWENELKRLFDMLDNRNLKCRAMPLLEQLARRCTTDLSLEVLSPVNNLGDEIPQMPSPKRRLADQQTSSPAKPVVVKRAKRVKRTKPGK